MAKPKPARPPRPRPRPPSAADRAEEAALRAELDDRLDHWRGLLARKQAEADARARIRRMQEEAAPD